MPTSKSDRLNFHIHWLILASIASCSFNDPHFFSHVYRLNGSSPITWQRASNLTRKRMNYLFFSRRDSGVTVAFQESYDNNGATFSTVWTKTGENIDQVIHKKDVYVRLIISGVGTLSFTETVNKDEFCDGKIYPINLNSSISLTRYRASPDGLPKLESNIEFCLLYANPYFSLTVDFVDMFIYLDKTLYTMGNSKGTLVKNTNLKELSNNADLAAACFYFETNGDYVPRRIEILTNAYLDIPYRDMVPRPAVKPPTKAFTRSNQFSQSSMFSPSRKLISNTIFPTQSSNVVVGSKTPTQTRKVNIITDDPFESPTAESTDHKNFRAIVVKSPLSNTEIATVATTASLMVGMIVAAVVFFLIYIRSKAKRMREHDVAFDDSDISDSSSSKEYSFSYSYYYSASAAMSDSYYSEDSHHEPSPKRITEQQSDGFSVFYVKSITI